MKTLTTIILLAMVALVSCKKDEPVAPEERCLISDTCYVKLEDLLNDKLPCDSCKNIKLVDLEDYFPNPEFDFNE